MIERFVSIALATCALFQFSTALGATADDYHPKVVGRKAAQKYMGPHTDMATTERSIASAPATPAPAPSTSSSSMRGEHYLALHIGTYVGDNAYRWSAKDNAAGPGKINAGLTYRLGEWTHSMDLAMRVDVSTFKFDEGPATKLSFLPIVTFPDASSRFPIYFGAGAGAGVFIDQINKKSPLSLDYQLILGVRFFEVLSQTGFFVEGGIKNHLFLLSDGQYNGTFVAVGTVFTF